MDLRLREYLGYHLDPVIEESMRQNNEMINSEDSKKAFYCLLIE